MGPIQTAIGQALGAIGGATLLGKKMSDENEGQVIQEKGSKAIKKEEIDGMLANAIKTAQEKKLAKPKQIIYDTNSGVPLATSGEMAALLSHVSYSNVASSKNRGRERYLARLKRAKERRERRK